jgi:hypothetical protein
VVVGASVVVVGASVVVVGASVVVVVGAAVVVVVTTLGGGRASTSTKQLPFTQSTSEALSTTVFFLFINELKSDLVKIELPMSSLLVSVLLSALLVLLLVLLLPVLLLVLFKVF